MSSGEIFGSGSKSNSNGAATERTQIPTFMEPFVRRGISTADRALTSLEGILGLTGGPGSFNAGPPRQLGNVRGPGGQPVYIDSAQGAFTDATGNVIAPFQEGRIPGLTFGTDNPIELRGSTIVGVGNTGLNELGSIGGGAYGGGGFNPAASQNLVAGFTPAQQAAQALGLDRALNGNLFTGAQSAIGDLAANGVDTSALENLQGLGLDPSVVAALQGQINRGPLAGQEALAGLLGGGVAGMDQLAALQNEQIGGMDALSGLLGGAIPGVTTDALTSTARGDFLYGGDGFNAAVDAAVRRATPGILSTFGSAGAGGASGGLAQEAIGRAAIDAFASQYGQERSNQLGAAGTLGSLSLSDVGQRAGIAESIAQLGLADRGQRGDFAQAMGNLDLANTGQQSGIAQALAGLDLQNAGLGIDAASTLGQLGLASGDQQLRQALGLVNANLGGAQAQLDAAQMVPGLATADIDLLNRIGGTQQAQQQASLDAPRNALLQLLSAALSGSPIESLLGRDATTRSRETNFGLGFQVAGGQGGN